MLCFDPIPIQIEYLITSDNAENNIKQKNVLPFLCQYLKSNISDIRLIPLEHVTNLEHTRDMIKGNESLVENVNFYFLTPLSQNFKMLHLDANPITNGYLVTEL